MDIFDRMESKQFPLEKIEKILDKNLKKLNRDDLCELADYLVNKIIHHDKDNKSDIYHTILSSVVDSSFCFADFLNVFINICEVNCNSACVIYKQYDGCDVNIVGSLPDNVIIKKESKND